MLTNPKVRLLIETSRAYGQGLLRGIVKYSRLHGSWVFSRETQFYRKPSNTTKQDDLWRADGIIAHVGTMKEVEYLISTGIPLVVQCVHKKISEYPTITTDDLEIGKMAANHLLEQGFRHFAFCGFENVYWSKDRERGFYTSLQKDGFDVDSFHPHSKCGKYTNQQEIVMIAEWLKQLPKPLALMACNDDRSQDVVAACKLGNLKIAEDIAIIGVDN